MKMSAQSFMSPASIEQIRPECDGKVHCHDPAAYAVRIHQVDCCEPRGDKETRDLTADGAVVLLLCTPCLAGTARLIEGDLANRLAALPHGVRISCQTCGRPIATLHDVLDAERL